MRSVRSLCAQTSATALNEGSSRSHTILRLSIESSARAADPAQGSVRTLSTLHLIDLAGSESARVRDSTLHECEAFSTPGRPWAAP